jgi:hypothetical protein
VARSLADCDDDYPVPPIRVVVPASAAGTEQCGMGS